MGARLGAVWHGIEVQLTFLVGLGVSCSLSSLAFSVSRDFSISFLWIIDTHIAGYNFAKRLAGNCNASPHAMQP
jgi:hypothetical protein